MPFDRVRFKAMCCAQMHGMPLRTLAAQTGISISTLSRVTNGETPDLDNFATLVAWLGVSADIFFPREPIESTCADEQIAQIGYALYAAELPEELCEAVLTIVRLVQAATHTRL